MAATYVSMDEAVAALRPVDELAIPLGPGIPQTFMHALAARDDFTDLTISGALLTDLYEVLLKPTVRMVSGFFGPAERFLRDSGARIEFLPADFRRFEPILQARAPRVMATVASPPDGDGYLSLSLHAGASVAELHRAGADPDRVLLVEANANYPRTVGLPPAHPHRLHLDEIDVLVEGDRTPVDLADEAGGDVERAIAEHARGFIKDGTTLQTGIGSIPSMIASLLTDGPGGDYGVHSEMFTNGLMRLHEAGKVSNLRKGVHQGYSVTTFAAGTPELYAWLDGNEAVRFLPVELVNSPEVIAANHNMVCINGALMIDLYGQVVADTVNLRQYSGIGGHEDFNAPSGLEADDRALLCLQSTAPVEGVEVSRIVDRLPSGAVVTTPRHQADVVVTEHGAADLRGLTVGERAHALADIAAPAFRDGLHDAADRIA